MQRRLNPSSDERLLRDQPEYSLHNRRIWEPFRLGTTWRTLLSCWSLTLLLLAATPFISATETAGISLWISDDPSADRISDDLSRLPSWFVPEDGLSVDEALFQEQPLRTVPRVAPAPTGLPSAADEFTTDWFASGWGVRRSVLPEERWTQPVGIGSDLIRMQEAVVRSTTDTGSLLGESPSAVGLGLQRRNPIVNDPRIRGSRIGRLPASGSYWVPARMDLDTMLSKIDSRLIGDVLTIHGPYAVRYGPGFSFVDFALLPTPRFDDGFRVHGATSFGYKANGRQVYGRQTFTGGSDLWGFRAGYGHRTGNDYTMGNGQTIASSYNSRDVDLALGRDFASDQRVEFHALRLDQTGVELPGQAFDIEWLVTDAYEVTYTADCPTFADRVALDVWYNQTRLNGNAQRPGKRAQFPYYDIIGFEGFTDVNSMSTGFRWAATWGCPECEYLTLGLDLRYVKQELNEITSGQIGLNVWQDANSPIPRSASVNPGVFVEYGAPLGERWTIGSGARFDWAGQYLLADPAELQSLGTQSLPLGDILGSDDFDRSFEMFSLYLTGQYHINECWSAVLAAGYAERPPSLTEMYAAETFMYVLQNGLNIVTGDPRLRHERLLQADLGLRYDDGMLRARVGGFYGWAWNYITFENMGFTRGPPVGEIQQIEYKFVNTGLATFVGGELAAEWDWTPRLTPFATLSYVAGTDRTRNGSFATRPSSPGNPSIRDPNLDRGAYSGIVGDAREPLPSILPLESRLGFRFHEAASAPRWSIELSARLVDAQRRVARSLLELPSSGFAVGDVRGYWRVSERLLATAGIENITNANYREHLNFTSQDRLIQVFQPGLNAYVGAELSH